MATPGTGYLLIADITGYTRYLTDSELDHARGILEELFSALLKELKSPFVLSNVQGDAILAHAPSITVAHGGHVIDVVESLYCAFADRLEHMVRNTTCTCNACRNISNLDLKLFVHHGAYVEQDIAGRRELGGPEVILIHRLLKNRITAETGIRAYTAFTASAVAAIDLPEFFDPSPLHTESLEQFGAAALRIVDMQPVWEERKTRQTTRIADEDRAFDDVSIDLPVSPDRAWHLLTDPEHRGGWVDNVTKLTRHGAVRGRAQVGTQEHCAHGDGSVSLFTITEWRPHERVGYRLQLPMGVYCPFTITVTPTATGSRATVRTGRPIGPDSIRLAIVQFMGRKVFRGLRQQWISWFDNLLAMARADATGGGVPVASVAASQGMLKAAVESRLPAD